MKATVFLHVGILRSSFRVTCFELIVSETLKLGTIVTASFVCLYYGICGHCFVNNN